MLCATIYIARSKYICEAMYLVSQENAGGGV